ncbi:MAG: prolyl oligopeptidase family serine peptidase [bacterium]|nr:prolyl oligopeptidase family serine peptidase [bacterium]
MIRSKSPQRIALPVALALSVSFLLSSALAAEGDDFLERYAATYRFRLGRPTSIWPAADGRHVLFLRSGPRSFVRALYELDVQTGRERRIVTADALLGGADEVLTAEERARRERLRLAARGIAAFELSQDGTTILVPLSGRLFLVDRSSGRFRELPSEHGPAIDPRLSPDGKRIAVVRNGEVFVMDVADGDERRLTSGAGNGVTHGLAEFVAQEEMSRHHGLWWSPDSRRLLYQRSDTTGLEVMHIMDPTHPERAPATWPYPRPGMKNADVRLGLISVDGGDTTWIEWNREAFEYLAAVEWSKHGPPTILVQNRKQTIQRLLRIEPRDGSTKLLLEERDDAWVEIDERMPFWLGESRGFLWTTERNGTRQLELRLADGSPARELTPPDAGFRRFEHYFPSDDSVVYSGGSDPTQSHLYRQPLKPGARRKRATNEPGVHSLASRRRGTMSVHVAALLDGTRAYRPFGAGGTVALELRSVAESPGLEPRIELTRVGRDPEFHAVIVRPRAFDAERRYPVIVHVYGGPTSVMVRADPSRYLLDQWLADRGYIVVAIDGRGTPNRGRAWHRAVKHDLIAVPLEDQVRALRLLGERYPELDLERAGIYGWSFGGYFSAMAVMRHPELFRAAVAGAPVVDWRDYDTHYTERYMDLPQDNGEGYDAANVLTYVDRLDRPLLIVHGTSDDNVYFMHSLKLADALFRAGKSFDFLPLPGFTHMVPDPLVTRRLYGRILSHFDRALKRSEP